MISADDIVVSIAPVCMKTKLKFFYDREEFWRNRKNKNNNNNNTPADMIDLNNNFLLPARFLFLVDISNV